jgi:hypothetical protein
MSNHLSACQALKSPVFTRVRGASNARLRMSLQSGVWSQTMKYLELGRDRASYSLKCPSWSGLGSTESASEIRAV